MPHETSSTLGELFAAGGPVMWPLLGASVVAVAVVVERGVHFARTRLRDRELPATVAERLADGDADAARAACEGEQAPVARAAEIFLELLDLPRDERDEVVDREGALLLDVQERRLPWLRLVVQLAPLLGLLGTVLGMLQAFQELQLIDGPIRPSDVAGGIGSALTTTVFGLTIAIPAAACLHVFEERVDREARGMGELVSRLEEALRGALSDEESAT